MVVTKKKVVKKNKATNKNKTNKGKKSNDDEDMYDDEVIEFDITGGELGNSSSSDDDNEDDQEISDDEQERPLIYDYNGDTENISSEIYEMSKKIYHSDTYDNDFGEHTEEVNDVMNRIKSKKKMSDSENNIIVNLGRNIHYSESEDGYETSLNKVLNTPKRNAKYEF